MISRRGLERGWSAAILLYLTATLLTAASWEPSHDEGVTWDQAIARIALPGPEAPVAFGELAAQLDGSEAPDAGEVVARLLGPGGMHPPAYYWALNAWVRLGGSGRLWLSLPMLVLGSLALLAFRQIARRLIPVAGAGELAGTLLAMSPWLVGYSVLARPYAMALCLAVLATHALIRSRSGSRRWLVLSLALSTLGLYSIYHYAFVCVWHLAWLVVDAYGSAPEERREALRRLVASVTFWTVAYLPWLPMLLQHLDRTATGGWYFSGALTASEWPAGAWQLAQSLLLSDALSHAAARWLVLASFVLSALSAALFVRSWLPSSPARGDRWSRAAFLSAAAVPLAILLSDIARDTSTLFLSKTSFVLLPIGLLCLTRAWATLSDARARHVMAALWIALFLAANLLVLDSQWGRQSSMLRLADRVARTDAPDHLLLLSSPSVGYVVPLLLALRDVAVEDVRIAVAPEGHSLESWLLHAKPAPELASVTLVDFEIPWQQTSWGAERLHRLARRATAAGWQLRAEDDPPTDAQPAGRTLRIASPVWVRFYSR